MGGLIFWRGAILGGVKVRGRYHNGGGHTEDNLVGTVIHHKGRHLRLSSEGESIAPSEGAENKGELQDEHFPKKQNFAVGGG